MMDAVIYFFIIFVIWQLFARGGILLALAGTFSTSVVVLDSVHHSAPGQAFSAGKVWFSPSCRIP